MMVVASLIGMDSIFIAKTTIRTSGILLLFFNSVENIFFKIYNLKREKGMRTNFIGEIKASECDKYIGVILNFALRREEVFNLMKNKLVFPPKYV